MLRQKVVPEVRGHFYMVFVSFQINVDILMIAMYNISLYSIEYFPKNFSSHQVKQY